MDFKEIKQIVELMDKHGLSQFELEREGNKISLKKSTDAPAPASAAVAPPLAPLTPAPSASPVPPPEEEGAAIKSPMVGTFYRRPTPDDPPFVQVGDKINEDTVVCIVEAMKVMNEVKAEVCGTINKILLDDSSPVQYGEPLFEIAPA